MQGLGLDAGGRAGRRRRIDKDVAKSAHDEHPSRREVALYNSGAHQSRHRMVWVFGHLGKLKGGSGPDAAELEPDPKRCGGIPLRMLAPT